MNNSKPLTETATWKYTDRDGDVVTGSLQEIGDQLIHWHGANRLIDNLMPWLNLDDYGSESPREFTLGEWIEWASRFEDRPVRHVLRNLDPLTA